MAPASCPSLKYTGGMGQAHGVLPYMLPMLGGSMSQAAGAESEVATSFERLEEHLRQLRELEQHDA